MLKNNIKPENIMISEKLENVVRVKFLIKGEGRDDISCCGYGE